MWHGHYSWSAWPMLTGGMLFWGSLVSLLAWGFHRSARRSEREAFYGRSPQEITEERYAEGEIPEDR